MLFAMSASPSPPNILRDQIRLFAKAPRTIYLGHISSAAVLIHLALQSPGVPQWFIALWAVVEEVLTPVAMGLMGGEYSLLGVLVLVLVFLVMMLLLARDVRIAIRDYVAVRNENLDLARRHQEAAAQADHANREKTRLLASASHDLRLPIHAIGLYLETLPLAKLDDKSRTTLSRIRQSLDMLSRLFNSLLDVSLLDSGKIVVSKSDVALRPLIEGVLEDYRPMAELANARLQAEVPDLTVVCDPILLRRMVQNLISNAVRYGNGGRITVRVERVGRTVRITVADEGPGIPPEDQAAIFEEFAQLDAMTGRRRDGGEGARIAGSAWGSPSCGIWPSYRASASACAPMRRGRCSA